MPSWKKKDSKVEALLTGPEEVAADPEAIIVVCDDHYGRLFSEVDGRDEEGLDEWIE